MQVTKELTVARTAPHSQFQRGPFSSCQAFDSLNDLRVALASGEPGSYLDYSLEDPVIFAAGVKLVFPGTCPPSDMGSLWRKGFALVAAGRPEEKTEDEVAGSEEDEPEWNPERVASRLERTLLRGVLRLWRSRWPEVVPFLAYPKEIRKILYTTNIIESLNAQLRKVLRPKGHFPNDDAVLKILFLALQRAKLHWKRPIHWNKALAHFAILFEDRLPA